MDTHRKKNIEDLKENNSYQDMSEADSKIYDFLDSHLEKENADGFSLGFSKNIIRKIEARQQRWFNIKIYSLISILVLMSVPLFIRFFSTDIVLLMTLVLLKYKFVFSFLIIAVVSIQFGEKLIGSKKDIR